MPFSHGNGAFAFTFNDMAQKSKKDRKETGYRKRLSLSKLKFMLIGTTNHIFNQHQTKTEFIMTSVDNRRKVTSIEEIVGIWQLYILMLDQKDIQQTS